MSILARTEKSGENGAFEPRRRTPGTRFISLASSELETIRQGGLEPLKGAEQDSPGQRPGFNKAFK